jgi:hypothetical protein
LEVVVDSEGAELSAVEGHGRDWLCSPVKSTVARPGGHLSGNSVALTPLADSPSGLRAKLGQLIVR